MKRLVLMLVLLAGCQPRPQALLPAPSISTQASHYAGTTISGPTTQASIPTSDVLLVRVCWSALAKMPAIASAPLGSRARLLLAGNTDSPLLGYPGLTAGVRIVEGQEAATLVNLLSGPASPTLAPIGRRTSALPSGVTSVFVAEVNEDTQPRRSLELKISRAAAEVNSPDVLLQCALTISKSYEHAAGEQPLASETALFDWKIHLQSDAAVLLVPMNSANIKANTLAISIEIRPPADSGEEAIALAKCEDDVKESAQAQAAGSGNAPVGISQSAGVAAALHSLADPQQRRASLVYLATTANAPLCLDTALAADSSALEELSRKIQVAASTFSPDTLASLAWALDRSAFEMLVSLADSPESSKLPPELATVLTQFCGEAARHSASLDEISHGMSGQADLRNRIIAQNLVFLTDSSPAARVRAFDWLNSRHLAPAGYDPLASARERRAAIGRVSNQPQ